MSKLSTRMFEEITSIVEEKFKDLYTVNKYAVLKIARNRTGEFVRYRDVRNEIDEIIFDVANVFELDLVKRFMKSPEGNVYMEYIPYEREVEDDDSDIYDDSDEDDKIDNDSNDSDDSDEDELVYYTTIDSQGRIYIPSDIRVKFDIDATDTWVFRDPERKEIVLNGVDFTSKTNLKNYAQIYVEKTLGLREGDEVKMYDTDEGVIIEPK